MSRKKVDINDALAAHSGAGIENVGFVDTAHWLDDDINRHWYDAFVALDRRGDKQPLIQLLKLGTWTLDKNVQAHLADLLQRHDLKRPLGRRPTPSYDRTQTLLHLARDEVRERAKGVTQDDAIRAAAAAHGISEDTLRAHVNGRLGSTNRPAKRRK